MMRKFILILFALALLQGCIPERKTDVRSDRKSSGRLSLFFSTKKSNLPINFVLERIEIQKDDGRIIPLEGSTITADAPKLSEKELLLWEGWLPPGNYRSLILHISEAQLVKGNKKSSLMVKEDLAFPLKLNIQREKNSILFLEWDPNSSIKSGYLLEPAIRISSYRSASSMMLLYVSDMEGDNITLVDKVSGTVIDKILVGIKPQGIAVSADGNTIYVANSGERTISVIDTPTRTIRNRLRLKTNVKPLDLSISPDNRTLYAINKFPNQLAVIDAINGNPLAEINVGELPTNVVVSPSGERIFVASRGTDTISVIDAVGLTLTRTIPVGARPHGMAFSENGDRLYVSNKGSGTISVIDVLFLTIVDTFRAGISPAEMALDRTFNRLYVIDEGTGSLLTFDIRLGVVISSRKIEGRPIDIEIDEGLRKAYVLCRNGSMVIINLPSENIAKRIWIGKNPYEIALPAISDLR